jgi:YidC/Oxa1 family membrane protein insertase
MEEKQSQLSTYIGMGLIFLLLFLWMQYSAPPKKTPEQLQAEQTTAATSANQQPQNQMAVPVVSAPAQSPVSISDTDKNALTTAKFGAFAPAATGQEQFVELENDLVRITFTSKGGRIKNVFLKKFQKVLSDTSGMDVKSDLYLLEDDQNRFEFELPVGGTATGKVLTSELYFTPSLNGNILTFRADAGNGRYLEQNYTLSPDNYRLDYRIATNGLENVLTQQELRFYWENHLDKLERNQTYERTMSSIYFKSSNKTDYCDCRKDDTKSLGEKPVEWFSHSNQFFNTSIVAQGFSFHDFTGEIRVLGNTDSNLKILKTTAVVPLQNGSANMAIYSGPNEFKRLQDFGVALQDIIPFGASVFGAINRWLIHPMMNLLAGFIGNQGIVILLLTLLVKLIVYPLTYRMVLSQSKMAALKPRLEDLKKKLGDDQQAMSVETMKMYSEYGVNPLGGCLPIFLQMPIWFALYRFFPASIEFRQQSFLWATDLSSYDSIMHLPFDLPFGAGAHISLFTLIWVVTTLWYTWYSMKQMDASQMQNNDQMKVMKYMQYTMPVFFMFFFNNFASGLTLYLCFSNILNIGQTLLTKEFLIDKEKIKAQLEINKSKPKKTSGFRARLDQAMKEQQRVQEEKAKKDKKK